MSISQGVGSHLEGQGAGYLEKVRYDRAVESGVTDCEQSAIEESYAPASDLWKGGRTGVKQETGK